MHFANCEYLLQTKRKRDVLALKLVIYSLFSVLRQGGTGFAASGVDLNAKEARPVMQV